MIKSIMLLFMEGGSDWRFWGHIAKILIILLCVAVITIISWRKSNNTFCKTCHRRVNKFQKFCNHCGSEMTDNNKEVIIGVSKKARIANVLAIGVLSMAVIFIVFQAVTKFEYTSYGTGLYTEFEQSYDKEDDVWRVECKKALSGGSFHQTVNMNGESVKSLYIDSQSSFGILTLVIQQGDKTEKMDITNTNGEIEFDLSGFDTASNIELDVEHTKVENVLFKITW